MKAELEKVQAHADAVNALFLDNNTRLNALIEAQSVISKYDHSPMRDFALQGLQRSIARMGDVQAILPSYARQLSLYAAEIEKAS